MKKKLKGKFVRIWIALFICLILLLAAKNIIFHNPSPSLEEVLTRQHNQGAAKAGDFSMLIATLVAFSMAAVSLAKSYELIKREKGKSLTTLVLPESRPVIAPVENPAKEKELTELKQVKNSLQNQKGELMAQKSELQNQLRKQALELDSLKQVDQMLRKSNIALSKECERLKFESEQMTLKLNTTILKPKVKKDPVKKVKAAAKPAKKVKAKSKAKK